MINEGIEDIIRGDFHCPRCGCLMNEKRPNRDKFIVRNKERTVRLQCRCGYYEDRVVNPEDFLDSP